MPSTHPAQQSLRPTTVLQYEDNDAAILRRQREQEAALYLWFNTHVRLEDVLDASEHKPKYEMTVTGKRRIKPNSRTVTLGTKVQVNGRDIALFKHKTRVFAVDNTCPHQGASLHLGDIEDIDGTICISCPRHHWPFSLVDGSCLIPIRIHATLHPVEVRTTDSSSSSDKWLYVGFLKLADTLFDADDF